MAKFLVTMKNGANVGIDEAGGRVSKFNAVSMLVDADDHLTGRSGQVIFSRLVREGDANTGPVFQPFYTLADGVWSTVQEVQE